MINSIYSKNASVNICKSIHVIYHINKTKDKNMIILLEGRKNTTKFNTHFL